jgi:hypothetical protein
MELVFSSTETSVDEQDIASSPLDQSDGASVGEFRPACVDLRGVSQDGITALVPKETAAVSLVLLVDSQTG